MYQYLYENILNGLGVKSIKFIFLLIALVVVIKIEEYLLNKISSKSHKMSLIFKPVKPVAKYATWGLGVLVFLTSILELDYKSILSTISFGGLAVTIVAQSIIRDMIVGFLIYIDGEYKVGDFITIHSKKSVSGEVISMGVRTTKLKGADGSLHIINNSEITLFTTNSARLDAEF